MRLDEVIKKLKGTSQKVRRAQIFLKADADGPAWTDVRIAEAFSCRRQTIEKIRQRLAEFGFQEILEGKKRSTPPTEKLLDGEQEAKVIATRLGPPPKVMPTGRYDCLPARWLSWGSSWNLMARVCTSRCPGRDN